MLISIALFSPYPTSYSLSLTLKYHPATIITENPKVSCRQGQEKLTKGEIALWKMPQVLQQMNHKLIFQQHKSGKFQAISIIYTHLTAILNIQNQRNMLQLLLFSFILLVSQAQQPLLCPTDSGLVLSGRLAFRTQPNATSDIVIPADSALTYQYSLPTPFNRQPGVIVSITSFSSPATSFLMFWAKPLPLTSFGSLIFLVRFYQKYTSWNQLTVAFLAEARNDIEADYYQIDTRQLGQNSTGKAVEVVLPINTTFASPVAVFYLSGFQIASLSNNNTYTPFEVTITGLRSNSSSLALVISTITSTQIFSLIVSYITYENQGNIYQAGVLQFSSATASFLNAPVSLPASTLAFIDGLSGFSINNLQSPISFSASAVNNSAFQFNINPSTTYLNYQFFSVPNAGNICFFCENSPIAFNGTCRASCPQGNSTNGLCSDCPPAEYWNGTQCALRCTGGRTWNTNTSVCQCPSLLSWNGQACISCPTGQVWNLTLGYCSCPDPNQFWNGYACEATQCKVNQVINPITLQCQCTPESNLNGTDCILCSSSQIWNGSTCICPQNLSWNGTSCSNTNCATNMVWNLSTSTCVCAANYYFNGVQCITCSGGMVFDPINSLCKCSNGQAWNGSLCISPCTSPFVYSNSQCICPSGTILSNNTCVSSPACPSGQSWNGTGCSIISCAVGFFWNTTACVQYVEACPLNTYWNGLVCVTANISCPAGSSWNGTYCVPAPACPMGTYLSGNKCLFFPQLCLPNYNWNGTACLAVGLATSCSNNQLFNGTSCVNISCSSGRTWSSLLNQCVCNSSSYWNGLGCIGCPQGQVFQSGGCSCPSGYFLVDNSCFSLQQVYCSFVTGASWNGTNCVCNPGFTASGVSCICNGLVINGSCNPCSNLAYSSFINGQCQCNSGYYLIFGQCKAFPSNGNTTQCNAGTILLNGICVPCSTGCLSCTSQTVCVQCRPQFTYNWATYTCQETCGDGYRFILPCDDGNNMNGDGCSSDCKVESGFTCSGGSPNSKDACTAFLPSKITLTMTGTSHLYGSINVNLRANYLPANLTDPTKPCLDLCQQLLLLNVSSNFNSYLSIVTNYIPGTLSFTSQINFGRQPIGPFTLQVSVNPTMASLYFPSVASTDSFSFSINPAFLSLYTPSDFLK